MQHLFVIVDRKYILGGGPQTVNKYGKYRADGCRKKRSRRSHRTLLRPTVSAGVYWARRMENAQGKIGMKNQSETAGWRDDSPGHPKLGAGPHVNAWNIEKGVTSNLHLDY